MMKKKNRWRFWWKKIGDLQAPLTDSDFMRSNVKKS